MATDPRNAPDDDDATATGTGTPPPGRRDPAQLAASVRASAQQIWLAGLGAFSKAQQEGGRVFDTLVKDGVNLQKKTRGAAEVKFGEVGDRLSGVGERVSAMASDVGSKAGQQWDKLEAVFDERLSRALDRLDVPTRDDVAALQRRLDELGAKLAALQAKPKPRPTAAKKKPAPAAAQSAAAKSAAAKRQRARDAADD